MAKKSGTRLHALQDLKKLRNTLTAARREARLKPKTSPTDTPPPTIDTERQLFAQAMRGVEPLPSRHQRAEAPRPAPAPLALKLHEEEQTVLADSLLQPMAFEDRLEMGEEAAFLRPGLTRKVLVDLRRGRWVTQAELDLHGLNRDQARLAVAQFLTDNLRAGRRCVRIIHGKGLGSPGRMSILKQLVRGWLAQREEILAFCQAPDHRGGSGAVVVLLRSASALKG